MVLIKHEEVPEFLRRGVFFASLDKNDTEMFEVPDDCFKKDLTFLSVEDVKLIHKCIRFWGVNKYPGDALSHAIFSIGTCANYKFLLQERSGFEFLYSKILRAKACHPEDAIARVITLHLGRDMVRWLHEKKGYFLHICNLAVAASVNDIQTLTYMHDRGCKCNLETITSAIRHNSLHCLHFAWVRCSYVPSNAMQLAIENVQNNNFQTIKYLLSCGIKYDQTSMSHASDTGNLPLMRYLRTTGCAWMEDTCEQLASRGFIECLEYANSNGCPWDYATCAAAAGGGQLATLQYLHTHGCEWDEDTPEAAAANNHLDCLRYAHSNGCDMSHTVMQHAMRNQHGPCFFYALRHWNLCVEFGAFVTCFVCMSCLLPFLDRFNIFYACVYFLGWSGIAFFTFCLHNPDHEYFGTILSALFWSLCLAVQIGNLAVFLIFAIYYPQHRCECSWSALATGMYDFVMGRYNVV